MIFMRYGNIIGKKFNEDGSVRRYPGNTVVAAVPPESSAYDVMTHLHQMIFDEVFESHLIP